MPHIIYTALTVDASVCEANSLCGPAWSKQTILSHSLVLWFKLCLLLNLPVCFHHGILPKSSPTVHQHYQYALHILPQSRSWQLGHRAHPASPDFHIMWQWCSHIWRIQQQLFTSHLCSTELCFIAPAGKNLLVWILAEDVPDDNNGFLHYIIYLGLNKVKKGAYTPLSRLLKGKKIGGYYLWAQKIHSV